MKQHGKKYNEWMVARRALLKQAIKSGRIKMVDGHPEGLCEDCIKWKPLTPDHRKKRSQGGNHDQSNIDWVCVECHSKRDNQGDPMGKKETKKINWTKLHICVHCKYEISTLLCTNCGKISIKEEV